MQSQNEHSAKLDTFESSLISGRDTPAFTILRVFEDKQGSI